MSTVKTQFFARQPQAISLTHGSPDYTAVEGFSTPTEEIRSAKYSNNGKYFAYILNNGVQVVDGESGQNLQFLQVPNNITVDMSFSPLGSFLQTWERPIKDPETGNWSKNLKIWEVKTGSVIAEFSQKNQAAWQLQFTGDEKYAAHLTTNEIHFYDSSNFKARWNKLRIENCTSFSLSPGRNYSVAAFVPEKGGKPAFVRIYTIPNFNQPVSQKTFFKAETAQLTWNKLGTSLLVLAQMAVDSTNKNYYGETTLYLLGIAGSYESRISLDKEGPIHDVAWSPNSREFGVVYGYIPSKASIFDARGNLIHTLPLAPKNTILFSPNARFVLVAGFGNLQGQVDIYDREQKFKLVSSFEASNTSVCEWSPCGKFILTATTSPRLRVDNSIHVWHYTGKLMFWQEFKELFGVGWRPQDPALFPSKSLDTAPEPHPSAALSKVSVAKPKTAGAYRPPHARGSGAVASKPLYMMESKGFGAPGAGTRPPRTVPGAAPVEEPLSKNASRNKKKREARKAKEAQEQNNSSGNDSNNSINNRSSTPNQQTLAPAGQSFEAKKIRSLVKKLRAIQGLKKRENEGETLEETQILKIKTEDAVRKDLISLGWVETDL